VSSSTRLVHGALLVLASFAGALAQDQQQAPIQDYRPVTDERLLNPEPENWLNYRRTYDGWGYSPLDQINRENVGTLTPVWSFSTGVVEGHESPAMVNDGIMYVTTPQAQVIALDAVTGEEYWRYVRELPADLLHIHPTNRGVGFYGDKVYVTTVDTHLIALDARTGEVVWDKTVEGEDYETGYYMTLAPLIAKGKVIVGVSGGELGIRGFIQAFDAETGESIWKTYTIPALGEPGNETWPGDTWQRGGGSVWMTGTYDPDLNQTYWGVGNAAPWIGELRPGDNLYTASTIALDVDTGEIKGHQQYHPNDSWDWDEVVAPLVIDYERDGETVKGLVHFARNGYLWWLERGEDGISFVDAKPYVYQNVFESVDPETGRPTYNEDHKPRIGELVSFCPSLWGGRDWPPEAYNPDTGYVYISANENLCHEMTGQEVEYEEGGFYIGADSTLTVREGWDHIGEVQAWDVNTGENVWTHTFDGVTTNWGQMMTTGGGLVFSGGTIDRNFRAFDAETGEVLWQFKTNSGVYGMPTTYMVDGVQYVAVTSGWGVDGTRMQNGLAEAIGAPFTTSVPEGGVVWVFALESQQEQVQQAQAQQAQAQQQVGQVPSSTQTGGATPTSNTQTGGATPTSDEQADQQEQLVVTTAEHETYGEYLTDSEGRTLYLFTADTEVGASSCYDACAEAWPPLTAEDAAKDYLAAGEGADSTLLDLIERDDGSSQVTYNSHPLYYFAQDESPGDVNGQAAGGQWYLVSPQGAALEEGG
jgi:alcohol dehydrogenase (cytochrome c)